MVICFIPGAGGHRYKRFVLGKHIDETNSHMHTPTSDIEITYRYLTSETKNIGVVEPTKYSTTHTMKTDLIRQFFPEHDIVKIKAPMNICLERQWALIKQPEVSALSFVEQVDQAYNLITWHKKYYAENAIDYECDVLIDIETDQTEFGTIMRRELSINNNIFKLALETFDKFGDRAPILDMFSNKKFT